MKTAGKRGSEQVSWSCSSLSKLDKCFSSVLESKEWCAVLSLSTTTRFRHRTATKQLDVFIGLFWKWSRVAAVHRGLTARRVFDWEGGVNSRLTTCFWTQICFKSARECPLPILVPVVGKVGHLDRSRLFVSSHLIYIHKALPAPPSLLLHSSCLTGKNS